MKTNSRFMGISAALFFGSLWGMAEATAGHALHVLRVPGLPGFLMFPLGCYFMSRAFARSGKFLTILLTSWAAASIKLVDVIIPGTEVMAVWNPVQAILLEGLAAAGFIFFLRSGKSRSAMPVLAYSSALAWRLAHLGLSFSWAGLFQASNIFRADSGHLLRFLILDSLVNGVLIVALASTLLRFRCGRAFPKMERFPLHPASSLACLAAAICLEAVL